MTLHKVLFEIQGSEEENTSLYSQHIKNVMSWMLLVGECQGYLNLEGKYSEINKIVGRQRMVHAEQFL